MINIIPVDDIRDHIEHPWCWCKPAMFTGYGGEQIVVHNSADGRELFEEDHEGGVEQ